MVAQVILYGIGGMFVNIFNVYCWSVLLDKTLKNISSRLYIAVLIMTILGVVFNYLLPVIVKIILSTICFVIICYLFVSKELKKVILAVIFSQLIIMLSEAFLMILLSVIFNTNDMNSLIGSLLFGGLLINCAIAIVSFIILLTKLPNKIFHFIVSLTSTMRKKEVVVYCIMIILVSAISTCESHMNLPLSVVLITNTIMALIFIFMVIKFAIAEDKYTKINDKYQVSINSLKEYEEILDKFRISTHENKNQLCTIRTMVDDPKIISYINSIIDEKIKDNEAIMNKAYKIPDARFRSILYPKICKIAELKIKYKFTISNEVKTADLIDMDDFLVRDACTILGVYLDNAIEAVESLKKKNIFIEVYIMNNYLCFDITNNFEGVLDVDKLFKPRYSTKGKDHGYGLSVVNKIVRENENIKRECEVIKNKITQRVKVKIK